MNVVESVFIQLVSVNPHFNQDYLQNVFSLFLVELSSANTSERYKRIFPVFC